MSIKVKIIIAFVVLFVLLAVGGGLYIADSHGFDNKKQYEMAEKQYENGNYQEAYVQFLKIKCFSKYRKAAILKQALSAEKFNDWAVAESKYEKFLWGSPNNSFTAKAKYSLAKSRYMTKNYEKAIKDFLDIKKNSPVEDYRFAADYFLGKISLAKNLSPAAKKYYFSYLKNSPSGTYSLTIAYDAMKMALTDTESVTVAKIFLSNQKIDEALVVLKDVPMEKKWTYLAIAQYYKNDFDNYKKTIAEGFAKYALSIDKEDLKTFLDFYVSTQSDALKTLTELQKSTAGKAIPDYFMYKIAQLQPQDKKVVIYKDIVKKYGKSEYLDECLVGVFFDFAARKQLNAAVKVGEIYLKKFPDAPSEPQILFWTGKYLLKLNRVEEADKYFKLLQYKYEDSYYAFRASRANMETLTSWNFNKGTLSEQKEIPFPYKTLDSADVPLAKVFVELGDRSIWSDVLLKNYAVTSWNEYKKGNIPLSTYLADKYLQEKKEPLDYSSPVWQLAFPIYYVDDINKNCTMRNLDAYHILALMREESHFDPKARSSSNALGLMQVMLPTASFIAEKKGFEAPDDRKLQTPEYNIALGTAYFSYVLDMVNNVPMYATGGYNGGPNAVNSWREKFKSLDTDEFVESIPYPESLYYIKKVYRSRYNYSKIYEN